MVNGRVKDCQNGGSGANREYTRRQPAAVVQRALLLLSNVEGSTIRTTGHKDGAHPSKRGTLVCRGSASENCSGMIFRSKHPASFWKVSLRS